MMKTAEIKADLYNLIEETEDIRILEALKILLKNQFILKKNRTDFWDTLPENVKNNIEEAIEDADKGLVYTHEEVVQEMQAKYNIKL